MFKRRLLACVAGFSFALPSLSTATLLPDHSEELPSSFAAKSARSGSNGERLENTATIGLVGKTDIFSRYKFPGVSFERAAVEGLSAARTEPQARTIEQVIAAATAGRGIFDTNDRSADSGAGNGVNRLHDAHDTGPTLYDLAQALINQPSVVDPRTRRRGTPKKDGSGAGYLLVDTVLKTQLDSDLMNVATKVVTPTIDPDGVVLLNVLGLRDFAFMVSPVTHKIQIVDFKTGTTLSVSHSAYKDTSQQTDQRRRPKSTVSHSDQKFTKILKAVKYFVDGFLLQPITLGAFFLLTLCGGLLRLCFRAA